MLSDVQIESMTFDFPDPKVERLVALTASDRKWMDDVVRTVEETYTLVRSHYFQAESADKRNSQKEKDRSMPWYIPTSHVDVLSFRGSDDDLRTRFEEFICAALASIKYADFLSKSRVQDISITGMGMSC